MQEIVYSKEWIKKLRNGMKQEEFCKHIYVFKKNGKVCCNIHRNTLGNWETGKTSLPRDVETFLSLVLWEYDHLLIDEQNEVGKEDVDFRNRRYQHARMRLQKMLHVDLYCRNLHDALLIQVTRGVLSFEEVPKLEEMLESELNQVVLSTEKRNEFAIERNTISISSDLSRVNCIDDLVKLITVIHRNSFAAANRIVGARFKTIFEIRNRYSKYVSLERAIVNLAPNYRNSYVRMFTSSFISREWLLDLCIHLKFSREETDSMLEAAHMVPLSSNEFIYDLNEDSNSVLTIDYNLFFAEKDLFAKLKIMLVLGGYVRHVENVSEYLSANRLLESFSIYEQGDSLIDVLDKVISKKCAGGVKLENLELDEIWKEFEATNAYNTWLAYVELEDVATSYDEDLQRFSLLDCQAYMDLNEKKMIYVNNSEEVELIHFLVAMYYSVLLEKKYDGKFTNQDLMDIKKLFDTSNSIQKYIYIFISTMLGVFLGEDEICETKDAKFYVYNSVLQKNTRALNLEEILNNIFEAIIALNDSLLSEFDI